MKKTLAIILAFVLVVALSVSATLAFLTDNDKVTNTFTVGDVQISLAEPTVKDDPVYGTYIKENQEGGYEYKLLPGHKYTKDPTTTVEADSEPCYVRMLVSTEQLDALKAAMPKTKYPTFWNGDVFLLQMLVDGWDDGVWESTKVVTNGVYEFRYVGSKATNGIVPAADSNTVLEPLFTAIQLPGDIDNETLATLEDLALDVEAQAIQADGFANAAAAWASFTTT